MDYSLLNWGRTDEAKSTYRRLRSDEMFINTSNEGFTPSLNSGCEETTEIKRSENLLHE